MKTEHIVSEPVRSYLLGQLADHEATALEEKYFMDRSFFLRVRAVEQGLIEDYLENRLPRSEREQFESRYLKVPALQQRLEEVRAQWARSLPASKPATGWAWRIAFAACLICVVGAVVWVYVHQRRTPSVATEGKHPQQITSPDGAGGTAAKAPAENGAKPPEVAKVQPPQEGDSHPLTGEIPAKPPANEGAVPPIADKAEHPQELATLTVDLGSRTGGFGGRGIGGFAGRRVVFQLPSGGRIKFVVHLPDTTSIVSCTPEIWAFGAHGPWNKIWSSGETVASASANGGQELSVTVDSSVFQPSNIYELRLRAADDSVSEDYRLVVTEPR